jgi:hypothetical protein
VAENADDNSCGCTRSFFKISKAVTALHRDGNGASPRTLDVSRANLRMLVAIHRVMFEKLLAGDEDPVCEELIALFEDIAATYAEIHAALRELAESEQHAL